MLARLELSLLQTIGEIAETVDSAGCLLEAVKSKIKLAAVGNTGESETQRGRLVAFGEEIAQGKEIAERFRHFLAFYEKMLGVQPVADEMFAGGGFALGDFVFVMWKGEIDA